MSEQTAMSLVFYWSGVAVWLIGGVKACMLALHLGKAACVAMDWMYWRLRMCRTHGIPVRWRRVPAVFMARVLDFGADSPDSFCWSGPGGSWNGYRKWTIFPRDGSDAVPK